MASAGGAAPGPVGCVGASSAPPPPPCPRRGAPLRAAVAPGAYGDVDDLRASLRDMLERLCADGDLVAALVSCCVRASLPAPPPPPRRAASPTALVPSNVHGGGDLRLRVPLREVFEWLVANGYVEFVASAACPPRRAAPPTALVPSNGHGGGDLRLRVSLREVLQWLVANGYVEFVACSGASPPRPRRAAPPPTLAVSRAHGGGGLRASIREVCEWLFANGYVYADVASAASRVAASARSPTSPPRLGAPPPAVDASGGHGGGDLRVRDPLRELFKRLVADGCLHLAWPEPTSPFRFCTIDIGRSGASYLLNLNGHNSEDRLLINQRDIMSYYTQGQSTFRQLHPRDHGGRNLQDRDPLRELFQRLVADGCLHLASPEPSSPFCFCTIDIGRSGASYQPNLNAHNSEDRLLINQRDIMSYYPQGQSLFRQLHPTPSLLFSNIGLKTQRVPAYNTTDFNSAIREFYHDTTVQLIGSCTSAPQFCLTTDNMSGERHFSFLDHDHGTRTDRWMTHEVLTCHQCEASEATIQYLLNCNYLLEQKLAERHEHNIAVVQSTNISGHGTRSLKPDSVHDSVTDLKGVKDAREKSNEETSEDTAPKPYSAPNSDTESAGDNQEEKLMGKFNKMLVDCVFFAMPQVLIFFPRYQASKEKLEQRLSLMAIIQHTENQSNEKVAVILFFVIFVSVWLLGLVLSLFGRGRKCTAAVSLLTLWTVGSTVAFVDYMLCKCLPEDGVFTWLFRGHCVAMIVGIAYIWFTYVRVPKFPSIHLPSRQTKYVCLPKFPSIQLPSCERVLDLLRGWRHSPAPAAPAVVHNAKAEDELQRALLPV